MIQETAEFTVTDGPAFEAAIREALPLFHAAQGCEGVSLHRVIEEPGRYRLLIRWTTLEDHTVTFRRSEAFPRFGKMVARFFSEPPKVTHSEEVAL